MRFPILDVKKLLRSENNKQLFSKFTSLSDATISSLYDANLSCAKIPQLYIGLSGKQFDVYRNDLVCSFKDSDVNSFHTTVENYRLDLIKQKMYHWYLEQNKSLMKDFVWKRFLNVCKNTSQRDQVLSLKSNWMKHARFSFYSSQALQAVATNYIPLFENYLSVLTLEFSSNTHGLSGSSKREIENYLQHLQKDISSAKTDIAEAMLARLQVASNSGDIKFDDVTIDLASSLKKNSVLKDNYSIPHYHRRELNEVAFNYFHKYILKNGTHEQKNDLEKLIWNQGNGSHTVIKNISGFLIIPQNLTNFVQPKNIFQRIFGRARQNQTFLQKRYALISQLRFPPKPVEHFTTLFSFYENDAWRELCVLSHRASDESENTELKKPTHYFAKLFMKNKIDFLSGWKSYITYQQSQIVDAMGSYIKFITSQLTTRLEFGLDLEALCSKRFQTEIKRFHEDVLQLIDRAGLSIDELTDYQNFLLQFEKIVNLPSELERANTKIETIDDFVEPLSNQEGEKYVAVISSHIHYQQQIDEDSNPFQPVSKNHTLNEFKSILKTLIPANGDFTNSIKDFDEKITYLQKILSSFELSLHCLVNDQEINGLFNQIFKAYLNTWVNTVEEDKEACMRYLAQFESLIVRFEPSAIKNSLEELITVRDSECWFVFQAKCYGLIASLGLSPDQESLYLNKLEALLPSNSLTVQSGPDRKLNHYMSSSFFHVPKNDLIQTESFQQPAPFAY